MKRKMISLVAFLMLATMAVEVAGCNLKKPDIGAGNVAASVVESKDELVVIKAEESVVGTTLIDLMEILKTEGSLLYEISAGMITSINGVTNAVDFSSCWMLYTSDEEMSNAEWGTVEYNGQALGSAIVGAEALEIAEGELYVWSYQSF